MLKAWSKLLNTECKVIRLGDNYVYPIFRNGSTSLFKSQEQLYTNEQITACDNIQILIRDPKLRFVSGINEYGRRNDIDVQKVYADAKTGKLVDRHFAPQSMWLLHLYKYYKGDVTLRHFHDIGKFTDKHNHVFPGDKVYVSALEEYVEVDYKLVYLVDRTLPLGDIIKETRHALS